MFNPSSVIAEWTNPHTTGITLRDVVYVCVLLTIAILSLFHTHKLNAQIQTIKSKKNALTAQKKILIINIIVTIIFVQYIELNHFNQIYKIPLLYEYYLNKLLFINTLIMTLYYIITINNAITPIKKLKNLLWFYIVTVILIWIYVVYIIIKQL